MALQITLKQDQLCDLVDHLGRLRTYYTAEAAALSRAAMARDWDSGAHRFAMDLIANRMDLARSAEDLWIYLQEI